MNDETQLKAGEREVRVGSLVRIITDGSGLAWGTDAYLLASYVRPHRRMCELGSGCGIISLLCAAHGKCADITAIELQKDSADRSERSAKLSGLEGSVRILCRDIRNVRYTDPDVGGRFDAVFANPPYISHPGLYGKDASADAARHELNGGIGDFCSAASRLLTHKGRFYCVFRPARLADLFGAMRENRLEPKHMVLVYPDISSAPSLALVEAVLCGGPGLTVSEPLVFYKDGPSVSPRIMTDVMKKIYEDCSMEMKEHGAAAGRRKDGKTND